jgi:hypothetical protein
MQSYKGAPCRALRELCIEPLVKLLVKLPVEPLIECYVELPQSSILLQYVPTVKVQGNCVLLTNDIV